MTDIFREVEEDLRRDKYKELWDRFGLYLIGAVVLVVAITSAVVGWDAYRRSQAEQGSAVYTQAVRDAEAMAPREAAAHFREIADKLPDGYRGLARLREAAALADAGDGTAAIALYDDIAAGSEMDEGLRGLAAIKAGILRLDTANIEEMRTRLGGMAEKTSPWRNTARELLGFAHYRAGDYDAAKALFDEIIADPAAAAGVRDRAHVMLAILAPLMPPPPVSQLSGEEGDAGPGSRTPADDTPAADNK